MNESIVELENTRDKNEDEQVKTKNKRGTRRQQRYRAKQKLFELCQLASAQQATIAAAAAAVEVIR